MKTAFYEPVKRVLVNIQERPFHHRDMHDAVKRLTDAARRMFGPVPGLAFCVWDETSLRIFPMNPNKGPSFDEVLPLVRAHGYVDGAKS